MRDQMQESLFFNIYGSPLLQAMVGLGAEGGAKPRRIGRDLGRDLAAGRLALELERRIDKGGMIEAVLRALIYVNHPERKVDERGFAVLKEISAALPPAKRIGMARFKEVLREQYLIVHQDEERAVAALPDLLPEDQEERAAAMAIAPPPALGPRGPARGSQAQAAAHRSDLHGSGAGPADAEAPAARGGGVDPWTRRRPPRMRGTSGSSATPRRCPRCPRSSSIPATSPRWVLPSRPSGSG